MIGKGRSIAAIFIVGLIVATTAVMTIFGLESYYRERSARMTELRSELRMTADQLVNGLAPLLWSCNFDGIGKIIESVMENRDIYAIVVKEQKKTIGRTRGSDWGVVNADKQISTAGLLYENRVITYGGEDLGLMSVYVTPRFMEKALNRSIVLIILEILVLNIVLISILFVIYSGTVLKPLKLIGNYAVSMSRSGGTDDPHIKGEGFPRELEDLKRSIEEMVGQINSRYADLEASQAALRAAEAKYRGIFENSVEGIFQSAPDGKILSINPSHARMHGYATPEEMIASVRNIEEELYVDPNVRRRLKELLAGQGTVEAFELETCRKDGERFWISINVRAVRDDAGELLYYEGTSEDITKRKEADDELIRYKDHLEDLVRERTASLTLMNDQLQKEIAERQLAEAAVRESEMNLKTILYSMRVGIVMVDAESHIIVDVNDKAVEMIGNARKAIVGSGCHNFICPADRGKCPITDLGQTVDNSERVLLTAEGDNVPIIKTVVPVVLGGRRALIESFVDITERKQMEEERIKLHKLESTGVLAGGIAHDFNNLLGAILGNISLALKYIDPVDEVFPLLKEAERVSLRASDLTRQFITFAKGGEPLKKKIPIADKVVDEVSQSLRTPGVKCEFRTDDDLWPVEVDEGQIRKVIHNMIVNACEAMPDGGDITVSMKNVNISGQDEPSLKDGNYVRITIEDHGAGIPVDNIPRIFDPYFSTKGLGSQKGTGLGLAVCYSIIRNHRGSITVSSRVGVGTKFHIYLPATGNGVPGKKVGRDVVAGKGKVLVVDDEKLIRDIAGKMLAYAGYEVLYARNGTEAIEMYRTARESQEPIDVVMMDLSFPGGMTGDEIAKRLLETDPGAIIVASSGDAADPVMAEYERYGFKDVIAKPYNIKAITEVMSRMVAAAGKTPPGPRTPA